MFDCIWFFEMTTQVPSTVKDIPRPTDEDDLLDPRVSNPVSSFELLRFRMVSLITSSYSNNYL